MRLTLIAPVPAVAADLADDKRTITGMALPYGMVGRTSAGPVTVKAGAVTIPTDLRRCKLFREHGRKTPVGYALAASETAQGLSMSFRAAATPDGDTALLEASEGVRDALSVELDNVTMDDKGNVTRADLSAVALVSIPAFADARLVASDTDPAESDKPTDDSDDGDDADDNEGENNVPTPTPPSAPVGAAMARRRGKGMSLDAAMQRVVKSLNGATDAGAINAALTDVIPSNDTSDGAFIRPQWIDELWTPVDTRRPYINSVSSGVLTGMKVFGWKWGTKPRVMPYQGNKTPVPSGPVSFGPAEADAVRHAGGWDVDNIYIYLGDGSLLTAILQAAAQDYALSQEAMISGIITDEATAATAADFVDGLNVIAGTLAATGARPNFIGVASDLWGEFLSMSASDAPWWLSPTSAQSVNLTDGTSAAADLRIFADPNLAAGHMVGGDRRAVTHYEPRGNPFRVQAVNLPNGGVDVGLFGFDATLVNDSRAVVDVTVGAVIP
jgi:hypothetical protein